MSNQNIVNIVELQNVITSASGVNNLTQIQTDLNNVKKMVNFDKKQILTNIISKYNKVPIVVTDPITFDSTVSIISDYLVLSSLTAGGTNLLGATGPTGVSGATGVQKRNRSH